VSILLLGFGSTRHEIIQANGVHYDCGCILTETGELIHFPTGKSNGSPFSIPAVYIAYFATYGAMVSAISGFFRFIICRYI
jgi:hypothetical protein